MGFFKGLFSTPKVKTDNNAMSQADADLAEAKRKEKEQRDKSLRVAAGGRQSLIQSNITEDASVSKTTLGGYS